MKKIIFLLLLSILILASCANSSSDKIVVWAMGEEGNKLDQLTAKYTKATQKKVEVVAIPWDQAHEKLTTAVAAKKGPDVVQLGTSWVTEFANAQALADLSAFASLDNFKKNLYFPGSQDMMEYNQKLVSIPWYVETRVLYYRSDLLKAVGYEHPPKDWAEFKDATTKLNARGANLYGIDLDLKDQSFFSQFAWQNGWEYLTPDHKLNFDSPAFIGGMTFAQELGKNAGFDLGLDITQAFLDGTFPMFISGPWMIPSLTNADPKQVNNWAIATLPAGSAGSASPMGGSNLAILEYSNKKAEAAAFINWLNTPDIQKEWFKIANTLPSQITTWADPLFTNDKYFSVFLEQFKTAKAGPMIPQLETIAQEVVKAQERVIKNNEDPAVVAKEIQQKAEKIFNK